MASGTKDRDWRIFPRSTDLRPADHIVFKLIDSSGVNPLVTGSYLHAAQIALRHNHDAAAARRSAVCPTNKAPLAANRW